jgi:Cu2+-containing amine oxidase
VYVQYFDSVVLKPNGEVIDHPNVVCLHEQDNGIGWKHTNWRTGRAVVTRNRELVVQFILTLANYEYVFAYKFNQSGGIDIETRATGIVSCVNIDPGKTSEYGNVVNPGVLAQNHQHIFAIRIDPAIDGQKNSVVQEESLPVPMNAKTNPQGNFYEVVKKTFKTSQWADLAPMNNRVFKVINPNVKNPISGRPVGYKLVPPVTQLLLADKRSKQARRAMFAQHHLWVTKYHDQELWAAGSYPYQSTDEVGGVQDMVDRADNVENEDVVLWSVFGLTHNPRVEDWPVMYVMFLSYSSVSRVNSHLGLWRFIKCHCGPPTSSQRTRAWTCQAIATWLASRRRTGSRAKATPAVKLEQMELLMVKSMDTLSKAPNRGGALVAVAKRALLHCRPPGDHLGVPFNTNQKFTPRSGNPVILV